MSRFAAFLRGVNLGKRQVKSADLQAAFETLDFAAVRTLLASGNVLFEADPSDDLKARIEAGLAERFGFAIGVVLRTGDDLQAMVAADPFGGRVETPDHKLFVMLFDRALPDTVALTGIAGDYDVVGRTEREVFLLAHRKPDGTYAAGGLMLVEKQLPKGALVTTRNWNTVLKAIA
jgi:uncharacterized protein (DUF1697 family)